MFFRKKMQKKSPFAWTFMGLEPIDNDTVALGAWRLTDILENLRDDPLTKSDRCCLITTRNRKDNPLRFLFFRPCQVGLFRMGYAILVIYAAKGTFVQGERRGQVYLDYAEPQPYVC